MVEVGTIRIKVNDLSAVEKTKNSWKKSDFDVSPAINVIKLFIAHENLNFLLDKNNPKFFKGQIFQGKIQGARINVLPNGEKLDKAYSLFSKNLVIHDESSHDHWDVIYQNIGGTYNYIYTIDKIQNHVKNKYNKVKEFEKVHSKIIRGVSKGIKNVNDEMALPMHILLKTYMRIGNEIYFKAHGHKGLTTLMKKDIKIDGLYITFDYLAKDGVPRKIIQKFSKVYVERLQKLFEKKSNDSFVFATKSGHPLRDEHFKKAFKDYCGKEFYPHIVRSFYATSTVKDFLKKHKVATKQEIRNFYNKVAEKLGHKKFSKKKGEWENSYAVTIQHYIQPELVKKVKEKYGF